ncbi:MAG: hypothetical protein JXX29_17295 [Deltaproteobacteria bacterium]|nr:hypothetical protein [Deltaproteobacteria bacterium]MBN2673441.1 hypothetical protein [Deltaproteobacteria bacterium]
MNGRYAILAFFFLCVFVLGCAPIEYSVVIVDASEAISEAKVAGASCTEQQLAKLSPVTQNTAPESGTEVASTENDDSSLAGSPMCSAPYEYYSALEFLSKAREEVGYSDYQAALKYARQARSFAKKARDIALNMGQERGREHE